MVAPWGLLFPGEVLSGEWPDRDMGAGGREERAEQTTRDLGRTLALRTAGGHDMCSRKGALPIQHPHHADSPCSHQATPHLGGQVQLTNGLSVPLHCCPWSWQVPTPRAAHRSKAVLTPTLGSLSFLSRLSPESPHHEAAGCRGTGSATLQWREGTQRGGRGLGEGLCAPWEGPAWVSEEANGPPLEQAPLPPGSGELTPKGSPQCPACWPAPGWAHRPGPHS